METSEENRYANVTIRKKRKERCFESEKQIKLLPELVRDKHQVTGDPLHLNNTHICSHRPSLTNIFPKRRRIGFYDFLDVTTSTSSHDRNRIKMQENEMPIFSANLLPSVRRSSYDFLKSSFKSSQRTSSAPIEYNYSHWWIGDCVSDESFLATEKLCQSDEEITTLNNIEESRILVSVTISGDSLSNVKETTENQRVESRIVMSNDRVSEYRQSLVNVFPERSRIGFYDYLEM